uniref:TIR domain-containing protein n=1 Tax=Leptobrachium leishanense TaxID=445787 RepID=A0A8C5N4Q2_9ANUR
MCPQSTSKLNAILILTLHSVTLVTAYGYAKCYLAYNNTEYADCIAHDIVSLSLSIQRLPNGTKWLNVSQNYIHTVEDKVFSHLPKLLELRLSRNKIKTIETRAFTNLTNLQLLDLSYNFIESLDALDISNLTNLRILIVNHNKICTLQKETLRPLVALNELDLSSNCISDFRPVAKAIENLIVFSTLNLCSNTIEELRNNHSLITLPFLQSLYLCNNSIHNLDLTNYFMPNLTELNILRNQMSGVNGSSFRNVPNLSKIIFDENPLNISQLFGIVFSKLTEFHWSSMRPTLQHDIPTVCKFLKTIPELQWLDIKHSKIQNKDLQFIGQCTNLSTFVLSTSPVLRLKTNELKTFKHLEFLHLDKCKIKQIQTGAWAGLDSLHTLILERNRLSVLEKDMFRPLTKLQVLDLSKNYLTYVNIDAFSGLGRLKYLNLKGCKIAQISKSTFTHVWNLRELNIQDNSLSIVKDKTFAKLHRLQTLLLSGNKISSIKKYGLQGLKSLRHLSFADNLLYKITNFTFRYLKGLVSLDLSHNHLWSFNKYQSPFPFSHLHRLEYLDLSYQHQDFEVSVPRTLFKELNSLKSLNLSGNPSLFLKNMSLNLLVNLTELDLSDLHGLPDHLDLLKRDIFSNLTQLRSLYLEKNQIQDLPENMFNHLTLLENLSLQQNKLRNISKNLLQNLTHLLNFGVEMNTLSCSCENYWFQNWSAFNTKVQVPFIQSFKCFGQIASDIDFVAFDLSFCVMDSAIYFFIGTFLTTLSWLVLVLMMVKFKWSLRYGYYILRAWFHWPIQKKERVYRYDAYLSYCSDDEKWVLENLLFQLESAGPCKYKTCFKPRDFTPGSYHIDNIQDAISNSRKTLCIISRQFLNSQWCRIEMEMACSRVFYHNEDVLVVVFLEEIPDYRLSVYHKLRKLLKQNTYINWPEDPQGEHLFWSKLQKALAKEKNDEETIQLGVTDRQMTM